MSIILKYLIHVLRRWWWWCEKKLAIVTLFPSTHTRTHKTARTTSTPKARFTSGLAPTRTLKSPPILLWKWRNLWRWGEAKQKLSSKVVTSATGCFFGGGPAIVGVEKDRKESGRVKKMRIMLWGVRLLNTLRIRPVL